MSQIDFEFFTGIVLRLLDLFVREDFFLLEYKSIGLKKKKNYLVDMGYVIKIQIQIHTIY